MEVLVPFLSFFLDFAVSRGLSWSILSGTLTSRLHSVAVTVLSGNPEPSMSFHGSNRTELSSWVVFFFYLKQWREMALAFALHHSHESEHVSLCVLLLDASLIPPPLPLAVSSCLDWTEWYPRTTATTTTRLHSDLQWRCSKACFFPLLLAAQAVILWGWPHKLHTGLYWAR